MHDYQMYYNTEEIIIYRSHGICIRHVYPTQYFVIHTFQKKTPVFSLITLLGSKGVRVFNATSENEK
jgi:hypothetical protein